MSIFTDLALPTTLTDLLQAHQDALRILSDARSLTGKAKELLDRHGRYLMPDNGQLRDSDGPAPQHARRKASQSNNPSPAPVAQRAAISWRKYEHTCTDCYR